MKSYQWVGVAAMAACLSLGACGKKDKAPTGQVVATVDGDEITARELQSELAGGKFPNDAARKAAEQQALRVVINRHVLAKAARDRGLDKTPDYAVQKQKSEDMALVQELQNTIVKSVPASTREEAQRYILANPDTFAQRKIFAIDQLRTPQNLDPKIAETLKPLKSIDEVAAVLTANKIAFDRIPNKLDAVGSDPKMIEQILKMKSGDMFAVPAGPYLLINQVKETRIEPFGGEPAIDYAIAQLTKQHTNESVMREYQGIMKGVEGKVQYAKGYAPPAAPKAAPATNSPAPPATNAPAAAAK